MTSYGAILGAVRTQISLDHSQGDTAIYHHSSDLHGCRNCSPCHHAWPYSPSQRHSRCRNGTDSLKTKRLPLHLLRGCTGIVAMVLWFTALAKVEIATATALSFSAAIFGTIAAVALLREQVRARRVIAIVVGFVGVLIVLRPAGDSFNPSALLVLGSSIFWGFNVVIVKTLSSTERTASIVFRYAWSYVYDNRPFNGRHYRSYVTGFFTSGMDANDRGYVFCRTSGCNNSARRISYICEQLIHYVSRRALVGECIKRSDTTTNHTL